MGLKTKQHSGLSRNIKSFTLNSILLNKINYMLLFKLFSLHPYPINIVSDSLYCFHIKKYRNLHHKLQSTCYSTTLSNYNLLLETAILPFILHIFEHIPAFPASWLMVMNRLINWFPLPLQRNSMLCYTTMLAPYNSYGKTPYPQAKEIINNCSTCRPLHIRPIAQGINPRGLQPNELWQMDVTHCNRECLEVLKTFLSLCSLCWPACPQLKPD